VDALTVLIVSSDVDPHVPNVGRELERRGARWAFLKMNRLDRMGVSLSFDHRGRLDGFVRTEGQSVPLAEIHAIWAPSPLPIANRRGLTPLSKAIIESEWLSTLHNLYFLTSDRNWVNPLDAEARTGAKIGQLRVARAVGFDVPPTLVTTEPQDLPAFAGRFAGGVANKRVGELVGMLALPRRMRHRGFFTRRLSLSDFTPDVLRRARYSPTQLQEYVPKSTEWRVYVVGDRVFGAEILSQRESQTATDWRRYPVRTAADGKPELDPARWRCRALRLPSEFSEKCRKLARRLRLGYTAMDFVRTPDGRLVFLEANYGGMYAWIEDLTHLPISEAMAELLLSPGEGRPR
jgi:hypothetical protein